MSYGFLQTVPSVFSTFIIKILKNLLGEQLKDLQIINKRTHKFCTCLKIQRPRFWIRVQNFFIFSTNAMNMFRGPYKNFITMMLLNKYFYIKNKSVIDDLFRLDKWHLRSKLNQIRIRCMVKKKGINYRNLWKQMH